MPDTPLNQDALEAASRAIDPEAWEVVDKHRGDPGAERLRASLTSEATAQVSAYLAAALPEVTEREQLTALPDKIVLEDRRGTIWQKINGNWYTPGSKHDYSDQSVMLPARVLYRPEVNDA